MLTPDQIAHFEAFGFLLLPQLFSAAEAAVIKEESEDMMAEARGGGPVDETERQQLQPFFERRPFMSQLPADDRIYSIGEGLFGPDFILIATEGSLHVGDTQWHGPPLPPPGTVNLPMVKIAFYLDALEKDTGCLRVIPGTHRVGKTDPFAILRDDNVPADFRPFGVAPAELPCMPLETRPGDVVAFTEHVLHASFGGTPGRHQHAVGFMRNPRTDEEVEFLINMYKGLQFALHPARSYINSDNPRLRRMVSRLIELGFEPSDV